ncbi:hypothetical protein ACET3Z_031360 [Daucus carota]
MADKAEKACTSSCSEIELLQRLEQVPVPTKKKLNKQTSMSEKPRNMLWERRRKQHRKKKSSDSNDVGNVTDEDLKELKGCIELGFGFNEEEGSQKLCSTLPALDLYFAVNRQFSMSPVQSPGRASCPALGASSSSLPETRSSSFISPSPRSGDSDPWKICSPGENPQQVKMKLRHWAQAVACSVMQSSSGGGGAG